jgi:hypothetical protein
MLLLVRLFVAASVVASSSDVVRFRRAGLLSVDRFGGNAPVASTLAGDGDERFHKRDPEIPDESSQDFETTVKCTKEREALAKELNDLIAKKEKLDAQCATDLEHFREMNALKDQQIEQLKPMVADKKDESELPPRYKAQYTAIMCAKLHDAYIIDDGSSRNKKARQEVKDICAGKTKLQDYTLESIIDPMDEYESETGYFKRQAKLTKFLRHQHASHEVAPESPECFQATAVQDQVDSTRTSMKAKEEYCAKEEAQLKVDLEKKRRREDALWTEYHSHVTHEPAIRKKEAEKVTTKFCDVVQKNPPGRTGCEGDSRSAIEAFFHATCLPALLVSSLAA